MLDIYEVLSEREGTIANEEEPDFSLETENDDQRVSPSSMGLPKEVLISIWSEVQQY